MEPPHPMAPNILLNGATKAQSYTTLTFPAFLIISYFVSVANYILHKSLKLTLTLLLAKVFSLGVCHNSEIISFWFVSYMLLKYLKFPYQSWASWLQSWFNIVCYILCWFAVAFLLLAIFAWMGPSIILHILHNLVGNWTSI